MAVDLTRDCIRTYLRVHERVPGRTADGRGQSAPSGQERDPGVVGRSPSGGRGPDRQPVQAPARACEPDRAPRIQTRHPRVLAHTHGLLTEGVLATGHSAQVPGQGVGVSRPGRRVVGAVSGERPAGCGNGRSTSSVGCSTGHSLMHPKIRSNTEPSQIDWRGAQAAIRIWRWTGDRDRGVTPLGDGLGRCADPEHGQFRFTRRDRARLP
jgi:hypothetical protein